MVVEAECDDDKFLWSWVWPQQCFSSELLTLQHIQELRYIEFLNCCSFGAVIGHNFSSIFHLYEKRNGLFSHCMYKLFLFLYCVMTAIGI